MRKRPPAKPKPPRRGRRPAEPLFTLAVRHEAGCMHGEGEECTCVGGPDYQVRRPSEGPAE